MKPVPGCSSWYPLLETSRWANKTLDGRRHHRLLEESLRADLTDLKDPDTINLREPAIDTEAEPGTGEQTQPPGETNVATTSHPPVPDLGGGNGGAPELRQRPCNPLEMTPTEARVLPRTGYRHSSAGERKEENRIQNIKHEEDNAHETAQKDRAQPEHVTEHLQKQNEPPEGKGAENAHQKEENCHGTNI